MHEIARSYFMPREHQRARRRRCRRGMFSVLVVGALLACRITSAHDAINRAAVLYRNGQLQEALDAYDHAIALEPNIGAAHLGRGNVLKDLLRRRDAIASYAEAARLLPNDCFSHQWLGIMRVEVEDFRAAVDPLERASRQCGEDPWPRVYLGVALERTGDIDKARRAFEDAAARCDSCISQVPVAAGAWQRIKCARTTR